MENVIIRPFLNEKTTKLTQTSNNTQFVFVVRNDANKIQIKKAVESRFDVQVKTVRTVIPPRQMKTRMTRAGIIKGSLPLMKKAYVTLTQPAELDFLKAGEEDQ